MSRIDVRDLGLVNEVEVWVHRAQNEWISEEWEEQSSLPQEAVEWNGFSDWPHKPPSPRCFVTIHLVPVAQLDVA